MTRTEFKEARNKLGLSHSQLGKILDTDSRTIRRWESDKETGRDPNPIACVVLKWMLKGFKPSDFEQD